MFTVDQNSLKKWVRSKRRHQDVDWQSLNIGTVTINNDLPSYQVQMMGIVSSH